MKALRRALAAVILAGTLLAPLASRMNAGVTFSKEVVRILQEHCQSCHHEGGVGPFPLIDYNDALSHARLMKSAVMSGRMPDGASARLDTGCTKPDTFQGNRRLTGDEIDTIVQWVDTGAPAGDPAELPPALTFADGVWKGGQPDVIVPVTPNGFSVPPLLGRDIFRRFPIRTAFGTIPGRVGSDGADRYLTGFEALPGSGDNAEDHLNRIVHHVTLWVDPDCNSLAQEAAFGESNPQVKGAGFEGAFTYDVIPVGFWVPGSAGLHFPAGVGVKIPANSCLIVEMHYATYNEVAIMDKTLVGLQFASVPVDRERVNYVVKNNQFFIPAGESHYAVEGRNTLTQDATVLSLLAHMHQIGADFLAYAVLPNGDKACLVDVQWDFTHQETYNYRQPLRLPAGTEVIATCWYDNTENNPYQFNQPPIGIPQGQASNKEMCQLDMGVVYEPLR